MADNAVNFRNHATYLGIGEDDNDALISNLIQGGQLGYGFKAGAFDAATPLVFPPAVIVVLQTPTMWDNMKDDGDHMLRQTVKSMFECHAKSVTGIDVLYTLENQEQPIGHDGQNLQVPTQSKRQAVQPNFTWPEVTGNLVWNLIKRWIWDCSDPDTNASFEKQGNTIGDISVFSMSSYALTFAVIQFDQTMAPERIIDASIITNVFPTTTGELGMQREIGTSQVKERSIQFTGYIMHNDHTRELGKDIATKLSLRGTTYSRAEPSSTVVSDTLEEVGLLEEGIAGGEDAPLTLKKGEDWEKKGPGASS